jgi:hypothetical protein
MSQQPPQQYQPSPTPEKNWKTFVFWITLTIYIVNVVLLVVLIVIANGRLSAGDMQGVGEIHIGLPFIKSKPEQIVDKLKEVGLKIDKAQSYTKEQFAAQYNNSSSSQQQIVLVGTVEGVSFSASSSGTSGGVLQFSEDADYSKLKGILQLAGAFVNGLTGTTTTNTNYTIAFRDKDRLILSMSGNYTKQESANYEAAFAKA